MSEILEKAVVTINDKMGGADFDSSVKFKIENEGSIVVDSEGVRVSDEETDCTLIASLDVFTKILDYWVLARDSCVSHAQESRKKVFVWSRFCEKSELC